MRVLYYQGDAVLEIEVKYPLGNRTAVLGTLREWGALADSPRVDEDHYFNAPDRDFKQTDEAFRLRRIGSKSVFTYKGPKRDTATKTRVEIELPFTESYPGDATRMLLCLGYRPVAIVRKTRTVHRFLRAGFEVEACIDNVEGIGEFVELEIVADETRFADAKAVVLATAAELQLTQQERRSYLEMVLVATRENAFGSNPTLPAE